MVYLSCDELGFMETYSDNDVLYTSPTLSSTTFQYMNNVEQEARTSGIFLHDNRSQIQTFKCIVHGLSGENIVLKLILALQIAPAALFLRLRTENGPLIGEAVPSCLKFVCLSTSRSRAVSSTSASP